MLFDDDESSVKIIQRIHTVNFKTLWKEMVVAYFKALSIHFVGQNSVTTGDVSSEIRIR
jgi:hypothetical protein